MSNGTKKGSDFGFYIFLVIVGILLIPLAIGVKNFDQILKLGKILLITLGVSAAILLGVLSYVRIMRRTNKRNKLKTTVKNQKEVKKTNEKEKEEPQNVDSELAE